MPLYDYECTGCSFKATLMVPVARRDVQTCPQCNLDLHRKLAAPACVVGGVGAYKGPASAPFPTGEL